MPTVSEIASSSGFRGSSRHRRAEPPVISGAPIDNASGAGPVVSTSIDMYVSGQYIGRKGQQLEVFQRYQVFVRYDASTQRSTMNQLRDQIMRDFSTRYGEFNISATFVPELASPPAPAQDQGFYRGGQVWAGRTSSTGRPVQRARFELDTIRRQYALNTQSVRKRYKL
jgi:hypothetical protein